MEDRGWMDLGPSDLSSFISHHIPTDMLRAHKNEGCPDHVPTRFVLLKQELFC